VTVNAYVAVLVNPPPVPVTARVYVPVGVDAPTEMVKVLVNVGLPEEGLKIVVAPDGSPEADNATV